MRLNSEMTDALAANDGSPPVRRPWVTVLASFIGSSVSISPAFLIPFGLYIKPMSAELGWSRTQLSLGVSVVALVSVLLTPVAGALIDRRGARPLAWVGAIGMPIALLCLSRLPASYPLYVALAACLGIVSVAGSPMTYLAVLPQWIHKRLGRAIAFSMIGLGVAQMLNSASTAHFIASLGWRNAWMISAWVIGPLGIANCLFWFKDNPAFLRASRAPGDRPALEGLSFARALRQPVFWLLGVAALLVCTVAAGIATHSAAILTDRGASSGTAAGAVMLLGLGSLTGRLVTGMLLDRVAFGWVGAANFGLQGLGLLLLWQGSAGVLALAAMFAIGLATGAEADIIPYALRHLFGMRAYGKLFGITFALYQLGPVFGGPLMGASFDRYASYTPMLALFVAFAFLAALLTYIAGAQRVLAASGLPRTAAG